MTRHAEARLNAMERLVRKWNKRLSSIDHNLNHYIAKKMPTRVKRDKGFRLMAARAERIYKSLGLLAFIRSARLKEGQKAHIFLCTANQAAKLRKLAETHGNIINNAAKKMDKGEAQ